jgi:hypothetical protein
MIKDRLKTNKLSVPSEIRDRVIAGVVKKLGVKDYFKLKDRFDGEFYLRKQYKRIFSSYFFERNLNIQLLDENKPLYCKSEFEIEGTTYHITGTYNPNKIKIPKRDKVDSFLVLKIQEFPPVVEFLGEISYSKCLELLPFKEKIQSNNEVTEEPLIVLERKDLEC